MSERQLLTAGYWLFDMDNGRLTGCIHAEELLDGELIHYTMTSGPAASSATIPSRLAFFSANTKLQRITEKEYFLYKLKGEA